MRRILRPTLILLCLAVAASAGTVVAADADWNATGEQSRTLAAGQTSADGDRTIRLTQQLRPTPEKPGEFGTQHTYRIPDGVVELSVTLPREATVTSRSGFVIQDGSYVWDGSTATPTLTYRMPANRTTDRTDPIAAGGNYVYVDTGAWAIVSRPRTAHSWGWRTGTAGFEQTATVRGEGRASDAIAFLGPHQTYTHSANGQAFELVVPEAATLREDRSAIFASLSTASDRLRVGDRDEDVFMIAAPTTQVEWGVRGLQSGPADLWVRDTERLATADNVWLHEYVHTRQGYRTTESARWFTEGSAVYYAALMSLEQGRIGYEAFRDRLGLGTNGLFDGVELADRSTTKNNADYYVGALVAAELDRQSRLATDRERSLQTTFSLLNAHGSAVDADQFETFLSRSTTADVGALGNRYTRTTERPTMWSETDHDTAFDATPARFSYALAPTDTHRVSGPYRNRTLGESGPITLVPGETLAVNGTVTNDGGTVGDYDAIFRLNGEIRDRRQGRLGPGEQTAVRFDQRFEGPGAYTVAVGDETLPVTVREPATATVTAFGANRTTMRAGQSVTLTVTISNDDAVPATLSVPVTRDGTEIATETVRLDAGEQQSVTVDQRLDSPGRYVFGLGERSTATVVVTVRQSPLSGVFPVVIGTVLLLALVAGALHLRGKPA